MRRLLSTDARGTSALEFALMAPVFGLLLAGTVDFGGALYTKFSLDGAVSAASDYAVLNASSVSSTGVSALATSLANIVASGHAANWANTTIVVNNVTTPGGQANADSCYCPTKSGSVITWGAAMTCSATCGNGSLAGKYVTIAASHTYKQLFLGYSLIGNGLIGASAVVQTQ